MMKQTGKMNLPGAWNLPYRLTVRAIVRDDHGRILWVRRSLNNRRLPGFWEWPGGKIEPGEDLSTALIREVKEETGWDILVGDVLGHSQWMFDQVRVAYLIFGAWVIGGAYRLSAEHDAMQWACLEQPPEPVSPQLKWAYEDHIKNRLKHD